MAGIVREPANAAREKYDLIIIGGGIYGAMLSLEASQRGLRSLLLERGDFGEHTSFNSLRIIHGGFRYLQSLDLHRFRESVRERKWFLKTFPDFIRPLPCLMPLYGNGLRRPFILAVALRVNDFLSRERNQGICSDRHISCGQVIDVDRTRAIFPSVDPQGLKGGAIWYDACVPDSQRLLLTVLRWAYEFGATALNYVEVRQLLKHKENVVGVMVIDRESGESHEYRANVVVNAAGPWCRDIAASFDRDNPILFKGSLMWNVLLDREAVSDHAVAVTPKKVDGQTYFLVPWKGKLIAGTGHTPWLKGLEEKPMPSGEQLEAFLNDLNLAVPSLGITPSDILHIFAGLLPVTKKGSITLTKRPVIFVHSDHGGPRGLYSISGIKFTTSRHVAEKTLKRIFSKKTTLAKDNHLDFIPEIEGQDSLGIYPYEWVPCADDTKWKNDLRLLIKEEAAQHLDDLIFRRTTLWENHARVLRIAPSICKLFGWDVSRSREELARLKDKLKDLRPEILPTG